MASPEVKLKICTLGERGVGKTSIIHRYVDDTFSEQYLSTLGVAASHKTLKLHRPNGEEVNAKLVLWDIMGRKDFLDLVHEGYFVGAHATLIVFDLTRKETFTRLPAWLETTYRVAGPVPSAVLGNKADLEPWAITEQELAQFCRSWHLSYYLTSARSGQGIPEVFKSLGDEAIRRLHMARH